MTIPFITTEKPFTLVECGNEDTGIIKLVKKGFISVAEQMDLDKIAVASYQYQLMVGELIHRMITEKKVSSEEAQAAIQNPTKNILVAGDYFKDIEKVWEQYHESRHNDLFRVTTAIRHRSLSEEEIKKFQKLKASATRQFMIGREPIDWDEKQTKQLPQQLFQEILGFFLGEQQGTGKDNPNLSATETKPLKPESKVVLPTG